MTRKQWRLKKALAGGGALPDVGIYCLNAARYISGEEPIEVQAMQYSTPNDPRFAEVEEQMNFTLSFPSGFTASCFTSYGCHDSKRYRVMGSLGWAELDPAFPYAGQAMRIARKREIGEGGRHRPTTPRGQEPIRAGARPFRRLRDSRS